MMRINRKTVKLVFIMVVIMLSFMSGALLHAYAGSGPDHSASASSLSSAGSPPASAAVQAMPVSAAKVTVDVCPGDTLWEIASAHLPEGENVRSYMNKIKKANGLKNSDLKSGQILVLP